MKRILFTLIAMVACLSTYAEVTGEALRMRSQIKNYLTTEGYVPTIDSDGDIAVKIEGEKFFISCENYGSVVYVKLARYLGCEGTNINLLRRACGDAERGLKSVRILISANQENVTFECNAFVSNSSQFTSMLTDYVDIIKMAIESVTEKL